MRPLTDEDGEVRELTAEDFRDMRPAAEADPGLLEAMASFRKKMGRPKADTTKVHIGFRLAADVVESLKASGPGYNARVEEALRNAGFGAAPALHGKDMASQTAAEERAAKKAGDATWRKAAAKRAHDQAAKRLAPAKKHA